MLIVIVAVITTISILSVQPRRNCQREYAHFSNHKNAALVNVLQTMRTHECRSTGCVGKR